MEERFYDFKVGTQWVFDAEFNGAKRKAVFTVVSRQPNRTVLEYDIFNPPDPGATASMDEIWYLADGYVMWGGYEEEIANPWWRVFKLGSKQGDVWKGPAGKGEASHLGVTEVVVPAGRYPDALHIRLSDEDGKKHDFYYAPRVGLVKWTTSGGGGTAVLQLRTFTPKRD